MRAVGYRKSLPIDHAEALIDLDIEKPVPKGRDLLVPEGLKRLSTSKTCFVFHDQNADRFAELEDLTRAAADKFAGATRAA